MHLFKIWSRDGRSRKAICTADFKSFVLKGKFALGTIYVKYHVL